MREKKRFNNFALVIIINNMNMKQLKAIIIMLIILVSLVSCKESLNIEPSVIDAPYER